MYLMFNWLILFVIAPLIVLFIIKKFSFVKNNTNVIKGWQHAKLANIGVAFQKNCQTCE